MAPADSFFSDFPSVNKAEWLAQVEKDLKGRSLDELDWELEEEVRLSPFYTAEDVPARPALTAGKQDNRWEVGEYVYVSNLSEANAQVREALQAGVTAPLFLLRHKPTLAELDTLLAGLTPDSSTLHFAPQHPGRDPAELFRDLILLVRQRGLDLAAVNGSMDFDPLLDWSEPPFDPLARILAFASRQTPNFRVLQVDGRTLH
ncbi:MAG: hypothetical protein KDC54_06530, partial [Lewinella sp.]|nr:hypothetical protein [Lewinella sp.]